MKSSRVLDVARELQLLNAPTMDVMFHGFSMEPLFREGDQMILESVAFDDIRVGDIITYRHEDKYPTRRVLGKTGNRLDLWCDNWPSRRFSTTADQVLARVVSRKRGGALLANHDAEWRRRTRRAINKYRYLELLNWIQRLRQRLSALRRLA